MPPLPPSGLALFLKHPEPGQVKSRLAAALGPDRAARLYWECALLVMAKTLRLKGADVFVFFTPAERRVELERLVMARFGRFEGRFVPQGPGDLGARIHAALTHLREQGYARQFSLGTDSPTLPLETLQRGLDALGTHDSVLGPTWDGSFYLIGVREPDPAVFDGVAWGSGLELTQTYGNLTGLGRTCATLPRWQDLDDPDDLPFLEGQVRTADYLRLKAILEETPPPPQGPPPLAGPPARP